MKTSVMEPIRYLTPSEMEQIRQTALRVLEKIGMKVDHLKALEYLIESTGINGNTVNTDNTAEHYKEELLLSPFFDVCSWGRGNPLEKERFERKAMEKARKLLAQESEPVLSASQIAAIDEIVEEARRDLAK
ncbi:MAG: hypothetical protein HY360_14075 [Verrucomicrobia bacterium]|nr:hypothetical protein [Verrucomicrobiota bacterium]